MFQEQKKIISVFKIAHVANGAEIFHTSEIRSKTTHNYITKTYIVPSIVPT